MEGEGFRDRTPEFDQAGARIFGISYDSVEDNAGWVELVGFDFPLLSDSERVAGTALEAERSPDDRFYGFPRRLTFLIDPEGTIRKVYQVSGEELATHADQVLNDLRALQEDKA